MAIDGAGQPDLPPGAVGRYNLPAGPHQVRTELVGKTGDTSWSAQFSLAVGGQGETVGALVRDLDLAVIGYYVVYNQSAEDRLVLLLKGGGEAPVSRPNVRPLRESGWF